MAAAALVATLAGCTSESPPPVAATTPEPPPAPAEFHVEEATIELIQSAIKSGLTTCEGEVQAYIERARAYNGVCTALITEDGADIEATTGYVRAGAPLRFPTKTVKASTVFPDL